MSKMKMERRTFRREFKLGVIDRLEAGESGSALGLELGVKRTIIYRWRDAWRQGGAEALRSVRGRPPKAEALEMAQARGVAAKANDLVEARRQIAELQRKVGQQQLDLGITDGITVTVHLIRFTSRANGNGASELNGLSP